MSRTKLVAIVVGSLAVASVGTCAVTYATMQRGVHYAVPATIDGQADTVQVHFNHWFPRWRQSFDFTMSGHIWFRDSPQFAIPTRTTGTVSSGVVQRWMMGHALMHRVRERQNGALAYKIVSAWEFVTVWTWANRPWEREANAWQHEIAAGTAPFIQVPTLPTMFPANLAEPPDTEPPEIP